MSWPDRVEHFDPAREPALTLKRFNPARGQSEPSDVVGLIRYVDCRRRAAATHRPAFAAQSLRHPASLRAVARRRAALGGGAAARQPALRPRRGRGGFARACAFSSIVLRIAAELAARALEGAGELPAGAEDQADELADRLLAGRQLADLLDALVADVDLAVEEDAAELELVVGLLLVQQQRGRSSEMLRLAVDHGAGAVEQLVEAFELAAVADGAAGERVLHDRHPQALLVQAAADAGCS